MPYKSDAERRFFHGAEKRGEISHETVAEYDRASRGKKLPERLHRKKLRLKKKRHKKLKLRKHR
jgi:hypothetical protein